MRETKPTKSNQFRLQGSKQSKLAGSQLPTAAGLMAMRLHLLICVFSFKFNFTIEFH